MNPAAASGPRPAWALLLSLAAAKLALHLLLANRYGYFRDELYFLDCGRHLDWGYVDHAPLIAVYARLALLVGASLPVLRGIAAAAGSLLVVLTGLIAWRLGGGRFGQGLAALAAIVAPVHLGVSSLFTMNVFEPLFWMGAAYLLIRLVQTGDSRVWLGFGLVAGLGLENKHSTLLFGFAVAAGLLLSPQRRELGRRWIWLGLGLALLLFLPNLLWQWAHGFPTVEDLRNVARGAYDVVAFARDDGGAVTASAPARITVTAPVSLPPPWQSADVGDVAAAGAASYYDGTFTVTGSGADIWNQADEFHFVHQPRSGDFEIAARVASVGDTGPWAMAGVMIRDGLAPDARHGIVSMTRAQGWSFTWREASGGASTYAPGGSGAAPAWVKLRRVGNELTALRSSNGTSWTAFARATVALPSQVHVGLAVSAVSDGALNTSTFDGVAIGDPTGGQVPDVTVDPSITYQEIDGFGVNANHRSWNDGELAPVLDALIDEAGMTLFRVVFDNADWEAVNDDADPGTMNQAYYDALYGSAAFAPLWNMAAHLNQRGITGGLVFNFMGPGPDWMGGATLAAGMEDEWAEMIASLLVYARTVRGLEFSLVAPNNEPDIFNEGIHTTDAAQYATALHALAERLDAAGLGDVRFVAPDRAGGGTAYMPELLADPVVMAKLAHIGVHSYSDGGGGSAGVRDFLLASDYPDRTFWMTEFNVWCPTCDSGTRGTYDWSYTRGTADYLLDHLENGASAGIVWEGYDSFYAHPPSTWSYWGLLGIDDIDAPARTYTPRKNFYTVAQVSRFVRAGDVRVDVRTSVSGLRLLAFYRPSTGGITIVGTNDSAQARTLTVDVSGLPGVTALQLVETTSSRSLDYGSSRSESGGQVEVAVAGDSVFTLTSEPIAATASCPDTPSACRPPTVSGASRLKIRNRTRDEQDRLSWTWTRGQATARDDLGEPTSSDAYDLCIYDAGALIAGLVAPAGGVCGGSPTRPRACWRENAKGLDYKDTSLTPNGVQKVGLRAGTDGRAAAALTGKGSNLRLPDLAGIRGPLAVQLRRHDGGLCLGATFSAPFSRHDANTLTVRSD